ncbi:hypothetical protein EDC04DRAFT_2608630 [Pisolithus marmoratus]|nr:hypothetical protein EDC04DRAFT_2608630 [Pisolithus marmoratus]
MDHSRHQRDWPMGANVHESFIILILVCLVKFQAPLCKAIIKLHSDYQRWVPSHHLWSSWNLWTWRLRNHISRGLDPKQELVQTPENPKAVLEYQMIQKSEEFQEFPEFYWTGTSTNEGKLSEKEVSDTCCLLGQLLVAIAVMKYMKIHPWAFGGMYFSRKCFFLVTSYSTYEAMLVEYCLQKFDIVWVAETEQPSVRLRTTAEGHLQELGMTWWLKKEIQEFNLKVNYESLVDWKLATDCLQCNLMFYEHSSMIVPSFSSQSLLLKKWVSPIVGNSSCESTKGKWGKLCKGLNLQAGGDFLAEENSGMVIRQ